jgi:hypothetical protein
MGCFEKIFKKRENRRALPSLPGLPGGKDLAKMTYL